MNTLTIGPNNASGALGKPTIGGTRYKEVKNAMLAAPVAREWKGGEAIPSEKRFAERFGVPIGTLRAHVPRSRTTRAATGAQGRSSSLGGRPSRVELRIADCYSLGEFVPGTRF